MVHFEKLLDPKKIYIFENRKIEKVDISDWNTNFFSRKVGRTILFVSESTYVGDTPYQVWFDLNNFLTRQKDLFLKLFNWKTRKLPYKKLIFFLGKLYKKFFLLYTFITLVIIHTKCGSLWTTPWPDKNSIFLKIEKSKKLIFPIETQTFFIEKLGGPFFLSQSLPTLVILHTKFGLIWTTSWPDKKDLFLKLLIWKNRKFSYEKLIFFLGKIYKFFWLYTFITLLIIHTKCGSLWTTPWLDKNSIFLKIEKSKKSIFPIEIRTFFLEKLCGPFFWSQSLPTLGILYTKFGLIWTTSLLEKRPIFKITYLKKSQISVWKTNFSPREDIQKIVFSLHFHYTGDYPYQVWFTLNNSLTR